MLIDKRINFRDYTKEDYRIEQYCKKECPYCVVKKNGQAFCWGLFKSLNPEFKNLKANGCECTKSINVCFDENYKVEEKNINGLTIWWFPK